MSPRMTALFGTLIGLSVFSSLFALLIQVFPIEEPPLAAAPPPSAGGSLPPSSARAEGPVAPGKATIRHRTRTPLPGPWRVSTLAATHRMASGKMKRRSFIKALREAKVPKAQIYRILKSMDGLYKLDRTGRHDKFTIALRRNDQRVMSFEYEISPIEVYQGRTGEDELLHAKRLDMKVRTEEIAAAFYVGKSLYKSQRAVGLEKGLGREINNALNGRTSTEAFQEGGVVRLLAVELTALGRFVKYKRLNGLEYRPPDPSESPARAYYFDGARYQGYVDSRGRRPSNRGWRTPIPGSPVTSHFNPKRMHPILKRVMPHNGTDYGAPSGTPVYAAYRGEISFAARRGGFGNLVLIAHAGGIETGYAHLSRFASGLKKGMRIGTRQLIGYVGSTGRSTGPHLHFSAKRNGKFFNALDLNMDALEVLPVSERSAFLAQKQIIDQQLEAIALPEPPAEPTPAPEATPATTLDGPSPASPSADPSAQPIGKEEPATNKPDTSEALAGDDLSGDIE